MRIFIDRRTEPDTLEARNALRRAAWAAKYHLGVNCPDPREPSEAARADAYLRRKRAEAWKFLYRNEAARSARWETLAALGVRAQKAIHAVSRLKVPSFLRRVG